MTLGKHETDMLKFVVKYPGLQSIANDTITQKTAKSLERKGFIKTHRYTGKRIVQIELDRR